MPRLILRIYGPASFAISGLAIFLLLTCLLIFQQIDTAQQTRILVRHNQAVLSDVNQLNLLVRDAERGQRGYVLTGNPLYLQPYESALERLPPLSEHLRQLVDDNSRQREQLVSLLSLMRQKFSELDETIQLRTQFGEDAARRVVMNDSGLKFMEEITSRLDATMEEENRGLAERNAVIERSWTSMRLSATGGSAAAVLFMTVGVLILLRGAVRQHEIEWEKEQQRHELARSNADLEDFAYAASHDLKAPLRGIAHLVKWIAEDIETTACAETLNNLQLLEGRVTRLQMLLDGLLAYSRIGRGNSVAENVDIAEMVRNIITTLAPPPGFVVVCEAGMPAIRTNCVPIHAVLQNLISNGLKHHDRAEGRVVISMHLVGGAAEFRISDDGPGIPQPFHDRIFLIFQTLESRDDVESSGVGLAIVMKHVKANGGQIRVESAPPARGTTFILTWKETAL
jgi:signal transduction histidine kinase